MKKHKTLFIIFSDFDPEEYDNEELLDSASIGDALIVRKTSLVQECHDDTDWVENFAEEDCDEEQEPEGF